MSGPEVLICAVLATVLAGAGGCVTAAAKAPFRTDRIERLRDDDTTRTQVLDWFGPPLAIARRGGSTTMPVPPTGEPGSSDAVLGFFSSRGGPTDGSTVYYYEYRNHRVPPTYGVWLDKAEVLTSVGRLWILLEQPRCIVADFQHTQGEYQ